MRQNKSSQLLGTLEKNDKIVARMSKNNNIVMTYYSSSTHLSAEKNKKKLNKTKFEKENVPIRDTNSDKVNIVKFHNLKAGETKRK